jgi:hypothetical protein
MIRRRLRGLCAGGSLQAEQPCERGGQIPHRRRVGERYGQFQAALLILREALLEAIPDRFCDPPGLLRFLGVRHHLAEKAEGCRQELAARLRDPFLLGDPLDVSDLPGLLAFIGRRLRAGASRISSRRRSSSIPPASRGGTRSRSSSDVP